MKLIVVCGPENSGKTTILKMAYEELKKINIEETHWFKYYDDNNHHYDFRDVLVLDEDKTSITNPILEKNFKEEISKLIDEIKKQNYKIDDNKNDDENEEDNDNEDNKNTEKLKLEIDKDLKDFNDISFELFLPSNNSNLKAEIKKQEQENKRFQQDHDEYLYRLPENTPTPLRNIKKKTVGFVLEGDYGFLPPSTAWWAKHCQNLYTHLKNVEDCDVIICACSLLHGKTILQQPLLCLIQFIYDCIKKGILTDLHLNCVKYPVLNRWKARILSNKKIVDWVKSRI